MYVTLIRPPSIVPVGQVSLSITPPLGLAYVAASLLQAGHKVSVIDAVGEGATRFTTYCGTILAHGITLEEIIDHVGSATDAIGISTMFSHEWPYTRALVRKLRLKFPNTVIILGGEHATALPDHVLETAPVDYCVLGEGDETIVELVAALAGGRATDLLPGIACRLNHQSVSNGLRPRLRKIDDLPLPAWELFPIERYLAAGLCSGVFRGRTLPIVFTRGCPYECTFCSSPGMWTQRWVARTPARVVAEMKEFIGRYQIENFDCADLTAIIRREWIAEFTTLLIKEQLNVAWQFPSGTRSEAIDAEICELLYHSGCRNLAYAPESGSPTVLKQIKKRVQLERMKTSMHNAIRIGINVRVNLVLGFPDDTHADIWRTFQFTFTLAWLGIHDISHFSFTPYPGSELFQRLRRSGRIPKLDDQYFHDLLMLGDITRTVSYADRISSRQLMFYRFFSLAYFYLLMFLFRPWRLVTVLCNLLRTRQNSRMEMALCNVLLGRKSATSIWYKKTEHPG